MPKNVNVVTLSGRLGKDPELSYTPGGASVMKASICNNQDYYSKQREEWVENPNWFRIEAWGRLAEAIAEKASKGDKILVEGTLLKESWTTKDGHNRQSEKIRLRSWEKMDRRNDGPSGQPFSEPDDKFTGGYDNDDIPF